MSLPKKHINQTKKLIKKVPKTKVAKWLLNEGYYPEQYIVPPCFKVKEFKLKASPYFTVDTSGTSPKFDPILSQLTTVSFPKSQLTDRTFGIIEPQIYHDIVWYMMEEWDLVIDHLFNTKNNIYSYSFPIPVTKKSKGSLGHLRTGRMIYEFLEMAENDLVSEAYKYKFILKTDITNFYPSIYTHSIAWALHTKKIIRKKGNRTDYTKFLGLKLDRLFQRANDGCTNGIAIGPAVSDLIEEVVLSAIDLNSSESLKEKNVDFIGVRYKDDYKILCQSKEDANTIIKELQRQLRNYNLTLNESKSEIAELPEGLFRKWTSEYQPFSLRYKKSISYKRFESSIRGTLKIDKNFSGGIVDRFLSELTTKNYNLKLKLTKKDILKTTSLLLLLKERRSKSFPQILGIIENMITKYKTKTKIVAKIENVICELINEKFKDIEKNEYDLIWLVYFAKSTGICNVKFPRKMKSKLLNSLKANRLEFFKPIPAEIKLFTTIKGVGKNEILLKHLDVFKKKVG